MPEILALIGIGLAAGCVIYLVARSRRPDASNVFGIRAQLGAQARIVKKSKGK